MARWTRAVLCLLQLALAGGSHAATQAGTGFFITPDGYIATNFHVVQGGVSISVRDSRGRVFPGRLVRADFANDVAIVKIEGSFPFLPLARSSSVRKGDAVFTLGYPNVQLQGLALKLTEGTVSSLSGLQDQPNTFQVSVPIQPGNSGGPLINREGAVVGLVVSKLSSEATVKSGSQLPEVVNYAVKSNYLLELVSTDPNVTEQVRIAEKKGRESTLPSLVARAESSVVLILVSDQSAEPEAKNRVQVAPPPPSPPIERQASASELFAEGKRAHDQGRNSEAFVLVEKSAGLGNADAQFLLGLFYARGQGTVKDDVAAFRWYLKAAEQGLATAQNNVGVM